MNKLIQQIQENREKLSLLLYFGLIMVLAYPLSQFLGRAWRSAEMLKAVYRLPVVVGITTSQINAAISGVLLGFLVLMTLDPKKRIQAVLLWLGAVILVIGLLARDLFVTTINPVSSAPFLLGGFAVGILAGGGRKLLETQTAESLEFRRASLGIYFAMTLIVVAALLEHHIQYGNLIRVTGAGISVLQGSPRAPFLDTEYLLQNLVIAGLFIVTVRQFVQYDAEHRFFVLGPRASGKSLFLIGAYLEALEQTSESSSDTPLNPSQDLTEMVQELDRQSSDWILEATGRGQVNTLAFQYVHGRVFPTNIQLESADYAGEYLNRLPDAIAGTLPDDSVDSTLERLVDGVEDADTLLLLLDLERFMNDEPLEISEYFSILQEADNKSVILLATKADTMAEEFREERGLEAHRYFDEFKEYVNERLKGSQQVQALIQETAGSEIHPVYYQTKVDENGDRVPIRDENNSVMTVGFDEFLEILGRRA